MSWNDWLKKAQEDPKPDLSDNILGGITDHHLSAYRQRQALAPMSGAELKAFDWVMKKLKPDFPDHSFSELIDEAESLGWFYSDDRGMLRVSKETPK